MSWTLTSFADDAALALALSGRIGEALQHGIAVRGRASLAVSGGSTPRRLFEVLAQVDLAWECVDITLVDERWVPADHPDANARLVNACLRQGPAARSRFIGLTSDASDPAVAEQQINERLNELSWPLDVAVLGMGKDGHTASFFPGAAGLDRALNPPPGLRCCAVTPATAPHPRMTLTLPALLRSRHLFLHVVGPAKLATLQCALQAGPESLLPVRAVLHRAPGVEVFHALE